MMAQSSAVLESEDRSLVGADRVLGTLVELSKHPEGVSLDDLAKIMASPKPTMHRVLAALKRARLAEQDGPGHYVLGDEFVRMAFAHHESRPEEIRVRPILQALAARFGETAHYAVLDGNSVVYRAKVDPSSGAIQLTSVVGGRNPAHSTAVGKVLLADLLRTEAQVRSWVTANPLVRRTPNTIVSATALHQELDKIRCQGYAVDDQVIDLGVNCLAVPAFLNSLTTPSGAFSVSAVAYRTKVERLVENLLSIVELTRRK
jgi:DNA-binding IclR family transcriptional regulator